MAEFLRTNGISDRLEKIIEDELGGRLLIISPYLQFSDRVRDELKRQDLRKRDIRVVFREDRLHPKESEWLANTSIRTSFRESLHAKCYMNDRHALITSMNLYEFSQQNNDEMGILVSAEADPELYQDIRREADRILELSDEYKIRITRVEEEDDLPTVKPGKPARRESSSDGRRNALPEFRILPAVRHSNSMRT